MEGDVFTSSKSQNQKGSRQEKNNFFLEPETMPLNSSMQTSHHINDYDYNILREDAYKDISDEVFKLEYKISKTEDEIKNIEEQIQAADSIQDYDRVGELEARKLIMSEELSNLVQIYDEVSLSAKISGGLTSKLRQKFGFIPGLIKNLSNSIISKLPGRLSYFADLRDSLSKLENINKSVDELISMQIPYGESQDKYEQLSRYIIKANMIQSDISKYMK